MNREKFIKICWNAAGSWHVKSGIGTLGEKTLHAVLKKYFELPGSNSEVRFAGYVADILSGSGIIEIQTRAFERLRGKLGRFLEGVPVTVVYPVAGVKWLCWIDKETGEVTAKRKSPKAGKPYEIFPELYKIKNFLTDFKLHICIVVLEIKEYRNLDGWSKDRKKGSSRYERIPVDIIEEVRIDSTADYKKLIPAGMPALFTVKDFRKAAGLSLRDSRAALNVLCAVGAVNGVGKQKNALLYSLDPLV